MPTKDAKMKKFLFFLLLIPVLASLGHDVYIYYQEPEKGFRLSDVGALWDKYHKETHDQWKTKVQEIGKDVDEIISETALPEGLIPEGLLPGSKTNTSDNPDPQPTEKEKTALPKNSFSEGFTQSIDRDGTTKVTELEPDDDKDKVKSNADKLISMIGFLLEQKAVFVFGAVPLFLFILNLIISPFFKEKEEMDTIRAYKKKQQRKGGGYKYSRK